jgi:hypothetical protein
MAVPGQHRCPAPDIFFALPLVIGYYKKSCARVAGRMLDLAGTDAADFADTAFQGRREK